MRLPAVFVESTAVNMTSLDSVKGYVLSRMMHALIDWWAIYNWFKNFNDDACTEVMSTYILS